MNAELTLGKYHYWDEVENDNIKRFHFMNGSDGTDHHIDFSPYHHPTKEEIEAVREIVRITGIIPTRAWNLNSNFGKGITYNTADIITLLEEVKDEYGE